MKEFAEQQWWKHHTFRFWQMAAALFRTTGIEQEKYVIAVFIVADDNRQRKG